MSRELRQQLTSWSREVDHIVDAFGIAVSKPSGPPRKPKVPVKPTSWPAQMGAHRSVPGMQGAKLKIEQQRTAEMVHNAGVSQLIACSLGPWQPKPIEYRPPPPPLTAYTLPSEPPAAASPVDPALMKRGRI
eukprot:scaffold39949_cov28-Tisochrysis_lutea.AAC.1